MLFLIVLPVPVMRGNPKSYSWNSAESNKKRKNKSYFLNTVVFCGAIKINYRKFKNFRPNHFLTILYSTVPGILFCLMFRQTGILLFPDNDRHLHLSRDSKVQLVTWQVTTTGSWPGFSINRVSICWPPFIIQSTSSQPFAIF
jgi:hypothetical protein